MQCYSSITLTDEDLDNVVTQINRHYPRHGYRNVEGHLLQRNMRVSRQRVRDSLCRVDPEGIALRWSNAIQRRSYNVYGPNALWHIDGQHGLIRWRLVIHGGSLNFSTVQEAVLVECNIELVPCMYFQVLTGTVVFQCI